MQAFEVWKSNIFALSPDHRVLKQQSIFIYKYGPVGASVVLYSGSVRWHLLELPWRTFGQRSIWGFWIEPTKKAIRPNPFILLSLCVGRLHSFYFPVHISTVLTYQECLFLRSRGRPTIHGLHRPLTVKPMRNSVGD